MLELRKHTSIRTAKGVWATLQPSMSGTSVYQSYYVNSNVFMRMPIYMLQERYFPMYLELRDDGKPVMLMPVCRYAKTKNYCSLGKFNGFQVYDFIYRKDLTTKQMETYLSYVFQKLSAEHLQLFNVPESSLVYQHVSEVTDASALPYHISDDAVSNVHIDFDAGYEAWHASLTKHARQNIRTAYNRMKTDDVTMQFQVVRGKKLPRKQLNALIDLYCHRHAERYQVQSSSLKRFYLKYLDFSTACLQNYSDNFYAIVYLNNKPAAFLSGLVEKDQSSIVVPRLCIDNTFSRYSPGIVLINEVIRSLEGSTITRLDLSKGDEEYKRTMGGQVYNTHHICFSTLTP